MPPIFIFLVLLGAVLLWFLLSFTFRPIGNFFYKTWEEAIEEINNKDPKEEREEESNERIC